MMNKRRKPCTEYRGGYAKTQQLAALLNANRMGRVSKAMLRVFAARLEREESGNRVSIEYLINHGSKKAVRKSDIHKAEVRLDAALNDYKHSRELTHKIPRSVVRAMAKGSWSSSVIVTALAYYVFRMPQRKRRSSLIVGERYARFTHQAVKDMTGLAICTISKCIRILRKIEVIAIIWRPMNEIKEHGRLYVDGRQTSISSSKKEVQRQPIWLLIKKGLQKFIGQDAKKQKSNRYRTPPKNSLNTENSYSKYLNKILRSKRYSSKQIMSQINWKNDVAYFK